MNKVKAKKSKMFLNDEILLLRELVLKHQDFLMKKKSDSYTVALKQKVWQRIETEFNATSKYNIYCSSNQLKKRWENMLYRRKRIVQEKQELRKTGGGIANVDTEQSAIDILLDQHVKIEFESTLDSDSFPIQTQQSPQLFEEENIKSSVFNNLTDETIHVTEEAPINQFTHQPNQTSKFKKSDDFSNKIVNALISESELRIKMLNILINQESELYELDKKENLLKIKLLEIKRSKMDNEL